MDLKSKPFRQYCRTVLFGTASFAVFFLILMTCLAPDLPLTTPSKYAAVQQRYALE